MNNHHDASKPIVISPGPTSVAGKAISSRNAMKHGCCSTETLLLPTENIEDFKALEAAWCKVYSPKDEAERHLVQDLVIADWFLQRATRTFAEIESQFFAAVPNPMHWDDCHHRMLTRFLRYRTTHTNTVAKCRKAIEDHRKNRAAEVTRAQTIQHKDEKLAIARSRLETFRSAKGAEARRQTAEELLSTSGVAADTATVLRVFPTNSGEVDWQEHLAGMRRKAIELGFTPPDLPTR